MCDTSFITPCKYYVRVVLRVTRATPVLRVTMSRRVGTTPGTDDNNNDNNHNDACPAGCNYVAQYPEGCCPKELGLAVCDTASCDTTLCKKVRC